MENEIDALKNPFEYQNKVLELMKDYENLIGDLYTVYAERGIGDVDFWKKITEEERSHAYWVETLANSIGNGKIYFNEQRFNLAPLKQVTEDIKISIEEARKNKMDAMYALSISNDIEAGMIERKFFEVFESDSAEIRKTFSMLKAATIQHRALVNEMWEKERRKKKDSGGGILHKIKAFFGIE